MFWKKVLFVLIYVHVIYIVAMIVSFIGFYLIEDNFNPQEITSVLGITYGVIMLITVISFIIQPIIYHIQQKLKI